MDDRKLPVQADVDERDLRTVVVSTYIFAGLVGVVSVVGFAALLFSSFVGGAVPLFFGLLSIICGVLYAWANVKSARAIAAREDAHLSFFVSGLNMAAFFPVGALLSMYTWRVLCRPTVRDIYADPHRPPSLPPQAAPRKPSTSNIKIVQAAPELHVEDYEDAEEKLWREMEIEHKKKKSAEAVDKIKIVRGDDSES